MPGYFEERGSFVATQHRDTCHVVLAGDIDLALFAKLERTVADVLAALPQTVHLDTHSVTFMDSSGLRWLLMLHRGVTGSGGTVTMTAVSPSVRRLLELTGLSDKFGLAVT